MIKKSKQRIIDDGREAQRFLSDPDFQRFLDEMIEACLFDFRTTKPDQIEERDQAYYKIQGVEYVRWALRAMVENAAIEKKGK